MQIGTGAVPILPLTLAPQLLSGLRIRGRGMRLDNVLLLVNYAVPRTLPHAHHPPFG